MADLGPLDFVVMQDGAPQDLPSLAGRTLAYTATLKMRPGPQILSLALTDEIALKTSYVQPHVLIGDKPATR